MERLIWKSYEYQCSISKLSLLHELLLKKPPKIPFVHHAHSPTPCYAHTFPSCLHHSITSMTFCSISSLSYYPFHSHLTHEYCLSSLLHAQLPAILFILPIKPTCWRKCFISSSSQSFVLYSYWMMQNSLRSTF